MLFLSQFIRPFSTTLLVSIPPAPTRSLDEVLKIIFGSELFSYLLPIGQICIQLDDDYFPPFFTHADMMQSTFSVNMSGYFINPFSLSKKPSEDFKLREYFFINGRPCVFPAGFSKRLTQLLKDDFNVFSKPFFVLFLELSPRLVDVNFTPDKRTVSITNENYIYDMLILELKKSLISMSYPIAAALGPSPMCQNTTMQQHLSQSLLSFEKTGPRSFSFLGRWDAPKFRYIF